MEHFIQQSEREDVKILFSYVDIVNRLLKKILRVVGIETCRNVLNEIGSEYEILNGAEISEDETLIFPETLKVLQKHSERFGSSMVVGGFNALISKFIAVYAFMSSSELSIAAIITAAQEAAGERLEAINVSKKELGKKVEERTRALSMAQEATLNILEDLGESKAYIENIVKSLLDALIVLNIDGTIRTINRITLELLGYDEKELIGMHIGIIFDEQSVLNVILERGEVKNYEIMYKTKGNQLIPMLLSGSVMYDKDRSIEGFVCVAKDITELKNAEEEIKKTEKQFMDVLYASKDAILLIDKNTFIECNQATTKMLGYRSKEEFLMTHPSKLSPAFQPDGRDSVEKADDMMKTALEHGYHRFEWIHTKADGQDFPVEVSLTPISYQGRTVIHCLWRDLTELKNAEKELKQYHEHLEELVKERTAAMEIAKNQAQESARAKSIFLANMSHEIRTPLNAIIGFSELLNSSLKDEKQRSQLSIIQNASKNLLTIINDILDLSKIEAGKMKIQYVPTDIMIMLKGIDDIFKDNAKGKNISFNINVRNDIPRVLLMDEVRIRQILFNIIGNAIKFTGSGSVIVTVSVKNKADNKVDLIFIVKDTGIGISKEQQQSIFEEFRQQPRQKIGKYGGTGLGLAISKRLIEIMNGKISVISEPGKGSIFTIYIPDVVVCKSNLTLPKDSYNFSDVRFDKTVMLVADDNADDRKLIIEFFEKSPVAIIEASNGLEAVKMAQKYLPGIILMDLRMPEMDGYKAAKIIKDGELTKSIPIIAISADVSFDGSKLLSHESFDYFLTKPLLFSNFIEVLKKFLKYQELSKPEITEKDKAAKIEYNLTGDQGKLTSELIKILENEFLPIYYDISGKQVIDLTHKFGQDLLTLGKNVSSGILISFAQKLCACADSFDIDNLSKTLNMFPEIIFKIKTSEDEKRNS